MTEDEAAVIAAAEMAADPVPDVMIPIPDHTDGRGNTFTGCWIEGRDSTHGTDAVPVSIYLGDEAARGQVEAAVDDLLATAGLVAEGQQGGPVNDCPFCARIKSGDYDEELSLPGSVAVFEPLNPVTPGHLLVVPFRHVRDAAVNGHVTGVVMEHAARLIGNFGIQANIITSIGPLATQSVFHLHAHVIPRREGDGLALPWTKR